VPPQPIAVVRPHWSNRPAEQLGQRKASDLAKTIPKGHIDGGEGDGRNTSYTNDVQRFHRPREEIAGSDLARRQAVQQIAELGDDGRQCGCPIGCDVARANDSLGNFQINQHQRPLIESADVGDDRTPQWDHDGADSGRPQCHSRVAHGHPRLNSSGWLTAVTDAPEGWTTNAARLLVPVR
jgi:hypothetical protein